MPGIFICTTHYKAVSRLLVFLLLASLSAGFSVNRRSCTHIECWDGKGWSGWGCLGFFIQYICKYSTIMLLDNLLQTARLSFPIVFPEIALYVIWVSSIYSLYLFLCLASFTFKWNGKFALKDLVCEDEYI